MRRGAPTRGLGVAGRIALTLALVFAVAATPPLVAVSSLADVGEATTRAATEAREEVVPLGTVAVTVTNISSSFGRTISDPTATVADRSTTVAEIGEADAYIASLLAPGVFIEERPRIDAGLRAWATARDQMTALLEGGQMSFAALNPIFQSLKQSADAFAVAQQTALADLDRELAAARSARHNRMLTTDVVLGVAAAFTALIGVMLSRMLVRPVKRLRAGAARVAAGEYAEVDERGPDELRQLAAAFNAMNIELRHRESELVHQAYHDPLTGLANRLLLHERLTHALARVRRRPEERIALLLIDLDGFKKVNDTMGHPVGDVVLRATATRLTTCVRDGDSVYRLGGDEFAVLAEDVDDGGMAIAERIVAAVGAPLEVERPVVLGASVGVVTSASGSTAEQMLRDADLAMYTAKGRGGSQTARYEPAFHERATERLELEDDLRNALLRDELAVHYQATVRLDSGRPDGVEALVRWNHPVRGLLGPDEFLPIAEETGLMAPLGWVVLRRALRDIVAWRKEAPADAPRVLAVNFSASQLAEPRFVERLEAELVEAGFPAADLVIEVTETTAVARIATLRATLERLRALGVRVALDDFGTGYSSLQHLNEFPVDIVKVDRSFVRGLAHRPDLVTLVRSIVELAGAYGITVVAEGVETLEEAHTVERLGCDFGQGFWFGRPAPRAAAEPGAVRQSSPSEV